MRRLALLMTLALLVGCGGEEPPEPDAAPVAPGPRTATAPDGVPIVYEVQGEGPVALVFIHGWLCDRTHWREQVDVFAAGHTVVTLDLGGHGESGTDRPGWPMEAFGADVQAVVEALDLPRVVLVGHSMGGPVALDAARRMPERVLGVVAVDALHNVEREIDPNQWNQLVAAYEADFAATCSGFAKMMFPGEAAGSELATWVESNMCDADPQTAVAIARQMPLQDQAALLAAVEVPVRAINSAETMPTAVEINRKHGDFDARIVEGAGHFVMLEAPEEFNRLLAEAIEELTGT